ncbi:MAG: BrnT family toxin [Candidatus Omnitrophota bacterium]
MEVNFDLLDGFDWDKGNINKNYVSHNVTFQECEEIFFNRPIFIALDHIHSHIEDRYYCLGKSNEGRKLFTVFTIRKNKIRIISSRDMSKKEKIIYESNT